VGSRALGPSCQWPSHHAFKSEWLLVWQLWRLNILVSYKVSCAGCIRESERRTKNSCSDFLPLKNQIIITWSSRIPGCLVGLLALYNHVIIFHIQCHQGFSQHNQTPCKLQPIYSCNFLQSYLFTVFCGVAGTLHQQYFRLGMIQIGNQHHFFLALKRSTR